jgi:hypothetical protein
MYDIQARIQSIIFKKNMFHIIGSASKIILLLKWHHYKQNRMWNFMLIGMWVFRVFKITQIKRI